MGGTGLTWNWQQAAVSEMHMYGLIRKERNRAKIANRIFEKLLLSRFLQDQAQAPEIPEAGKEQAAGC
jgi:hypothetical protein